MMPNREAGNGVGDDHHAAGPHVEGRTVLHRLADAERNGDQVRYQRDPEAERDGDRHLFQDQIQHRNVTEIAVAKIEAGIVPEHLEEAFEWRLVEAELLFQLLDEFRIQPLRAAIFVAFSPCIEIAARARVSTTAGNRVAALLAGNARNHLLHRSARRELDDKERHGHDAEQRRDHQQDAAEDIVGHQNMWAGQDRVGQCRAR
jgi:hypothetical protein